MWQSVVGVGDREKRWREGGGDTWHGPKGRVMMEMGPTCQVALISIKWKRKRTCKRTGVRGNATCVRGRGWHVALRVRGVFCATAHQSTTSESDPSVSLWATLVTSACARVTLTSRFPTNYKTSQWTFFALPYKKRESFMELLLCCLLYTSPSPRD